MNTSFLKLSLAGVSGFAFACILVIGSFVFTGSNVMIEKKFTVTARVDNALTEINCSTVSSFGTMFRKNSEVIIQGYGHRENVGYVVHGVVLTNQAGGMIDTPYGYYTTLNGYSTYRGEHSDFGNKKIAGEVANACLKNIDVMMIL